MKRITASVVLVLIFIFAQSFNYASAQWVSTNGPVGGYVNSLTNIDGILYMTSKSGVFKYEIANGNWTDISYGLTTFDVSYLVKAKDTLYAIANHPWASAQQTYVFKRATTGGAWIIAATITAVDFYGMIYKDGYFYMTTGSSYIYRYDSLFNNLKTLQTGAGESGGAMCLKGDTMFAVFGSSPFYSVDNGASWIYAGNYQLNSEVKAMAVTSSAMYVACSNGIYRSITGTSWTQLYSTESQYDINKFYVHDDTLLVTCEIDRLVGSTNGGLTWDTLQWLKGTLLSNRAVCALGNKVFLGTRNGGVRTTSDWGQSWEAQNTGFVGSNVFSIDAATIVAVGVADDNLYVSADHGQTWMTSDSAVPVSYQPDVEVKNDTIYVGTPFDHLYISSDAGMTWEVKTSAPSAIKNLMVKGDTIYAFSWYHGSISFNGGIGWNEMNLSYTGIYIFDSEFIYGRILATIEDNNDAYQLMASDNNGWNWYVINSSANFRRLERLDNRLFASDNHGKVYVSVDAGQNWIIKSNGIPDKMNITDLHFMNGVGLFVSGDSGVYLSQDFGNTWNQINSGLKIKAVTCLASDSDYLYAGISHGGIYKLPGNMLIPEIQTGHFNSMVVFPNPASDILICKNSFHDVTLRIMSIEGNVVKEVYVRNEKDYKLDISELAPGLFFISTSDGKQSKFLKEN